MATWFAPSPIVSCIEKVVLNRLTLKNNMIGEWMNECLSYFMTAPLYKGPNQMAIDLYNVITHLIDKYI